MDITALVTESRTVEAELWIFMHTRRKNNPVQFLCSKNCSRQLQGLCASRRGAACSIVERYCEDEPPLAGHAMNFAIMDPSLRG